MNHNVVAGHKIFFSQLFPDVYQMVKDGLTRHFHVLQLRCLCKLLDDCAEKMTQEIIRRPEHPAKKESPFLDLNDLRGFSEERVDAYVISWHERISMYEELNIVRIVIPKVYEFSRNQILLCGCEKEIPLTEGDIIALSMILVKNTHVFYTNKNWWSNKRLIAQTFERWFTRQ